MQKLALAFAVVATLVAASPAAQAKKAAEKFHCVKGGREAPDLTNAGDCAAAGGTWEKAGTKSTGHGKPHDYPIPPAQR